MQRSLLCFLNRRSEIRKGATYREPFDWLLPNGDRDVERHNTFFNSLLDILLTHCTYFVGFNYFPMGEKRQQREAYERCVIDAVKGRNRDVAYKIGSELSLVFAQIGRASCRERV